MSDRIAPFAKHRFMFGYPVVIADKIETINEGTVYRFVSTREHVLSRGDVIYCVHKTDDYVEAVLCCLLRTGATYYARPLTHDDHIDSVRGVANVGL